MAALQLARWSELAWVRLAEIATAQFLPGRPAESKATLGELITRHQREAACQVAEVFTWRGERDRAFEWLERTLPSATRHPRCWWRWRWASRSPLTRYAGSWTAAERGIQNRGADQL